VFSHSTLATEIESTIVLTAVTVNYWQSALASNSAGPTSAKKIQARSICGSSDQRIPSHIPQVTRLLEATGYSGGCTGTLVSPSCIITAGHCEASLKFAQFNVSADGKSCRPEDVYEVDPNSVLIASED